MRENLEITVTIGNRSISVTANKAMKTSLLVEKLQARGIRLSLDNGQLSYSADKPMPTGIVTTLTVETPRIVRHLESLAPHSPDVQPTRETASAAPPTVSERSEDAALTLEKVLEIFPAAGPVEWTPKAERKKVVN
jgi:hypothetical protein